MAQKEGENSKNWMFTARVWKTGGSYVVTIPKNFIDVGVVGKGDLLTFRNIEGLRHPRNSQKVKIE